MLMSHLRLAAIVISTAVGHERHHMRAPSRFSYRRGRRPQQDLSFQSRR
jgi:hypothetical protein